MKGIETLSKTQQKTLNIPFVMLPCPFCGAEVFIGKHQYHKGAYIVRCSSDGSCCPFFPSSGVLAFNKVETYINNWNDRTLKTNNFNQK